MSITLNQLAWNESCCADGIQWIEIEMPSGDWLRIKKPLLGGYRVTRFGADKRLSVPEAEMSTDEVVALLA